MSKYYHFTSYDNLESISKEGLVPKLGNRSKSIGEVIEAVFLSENMDGAIMMYCLFLFHYITTKSDFAYDMINYERRFYYKLEKELESNNLVTLKTEEECKKTMAALKKDIDKVSEMVGYRSFRDYPGTGCYLVIEGIDNIYLKGPGNSVTFDAISPENIKVVTLKNKKGEYIDDKETVLCYFMSQVSLDEMLNEISDRSGVIAMKKLYKDNEKQIEELRASDYTLEEIPIKTYVSSDKHKRIRSE